MFANIPIDRADLFRILPEIVLTAVLIFCFRIMTDMRFNPGIRFYGIASHILNCCLVKRIIERSETVRRCCPLRYDVLMTTVTGFCTD